VDPTPAARRFAFGAGILWHPQFASQMLSFFFPFTPFTTAGSTNQN
jgi:hypothetical protein